ncbi:hypothetical protein LS71_007905 [Helicobacter jaachi]|uniref:Porin n=1 Tax=Helicobacter jaachi TaxID=1677920 RepID=A0A4U8TAP4_9HELI|nr:hypothetical protein [Helicobacter jaachi]TLD95757.1 hypothetical protein LS71_007905 [Helicobacter jaachi]
MKKVYVSLAVATSLAVSMNAAEINPFGHLGAFYHQGLGGMGVLDKNGKEVQAAYANVSARAGIDIGLGSNISIGLGGWGGYPFYSTGFNPSSGDEDLVGESAFPKKGDVSDAYVRYDGTTLSFALGRFDMGEFFLGKAKDSETKSYTGVDWIYGNVQGGALNVQGGVMGLWAYWRNSALGAGQAYNRMGYELSSFDTYQNYKNSTDIGELVGAGLDFDFGVVKLSPFVSYLTDVNTSVDSVKNTNGVDDVLNAGAKAQIELGSGNLKSITTLRAVYGTSNITGKGNSTNGLTFWADEELRFNDIFKFGAGYVSQDENSNLLDFGNRARFYGYRNGMPNMYGTYGSNLGAGYGQSTYYVFGGIEAKRVGLDLLWSGGDYKELSAVGSLKIWERGDKLYFTVGAGYIHNEVPAGKDQNSVLAFGKLGF